jgi:hypothetical protein
MLSDHLQMASIHSGALRANCGTFQGRIVDKDEDSAAHKQGI